MTLRVDHSTAVAQAAALHSEQYSGISVFIFLLFQSNGALVLSNLPVSSHRVVPTTVAIKFKSYLCSFWCFDDKILPAIIETISALCAFSVSG